MGLFVSSAWEKEGGGFRKENTANGVLYGRGSLKYLRQLLSRDGRSVLGLCTGHSLCTRYGPYFDIRIQAYAKKMWNEST
jgi:hypothetical protein